MNLKNNILVLLKIISFTDWDWLRLNLNKQMTRMTQRCWPAADTQFCFLFSLWDRLHGDVTRRSLHYPVWASPDSSSHGAPSSSHQWVPGPPNHGGCDKFRTIQSINNSLHHGGVPVAILDRYVVPAWAANWKKKFRIHAAAIDLTIECWISITLASTLRNEQHNITPSPYP